jgi:phage terminase large subunit
MTDQTPTKPPEKTILLHPKQMKAFSFVTQFCAAIAGVRGGKTYVGSIWAAHKIVTSSGNGLITAPDYKTLNDATLDTFFGIFPQYRQFYKQQKSLIELPGKTIFLRSLDNPLSAEGLTVDWIWGDEAGKYKLLAWHSLRSRVSLTKGQILLTTTPYNMGWLYEEFFKPWQEKTDPDLTVVTWASVENPGFPQEVYESEMKRLPAAEFKRRYEGTFARMQGLVYNLPNRSVIDPDSAIPAAQITLGGIDWGWSNPAAIVIIKIINGAYYIVDEWYQTEKTTTQIIEKAIELQNTWGVNRWYADSANPEKVAEANTNTGLLVLGYEKKKDSISYGINYINQCMMENRFFVFRGLNDIMSEFETYQYPEQGDDAKKAKDNPMPFNDHLMDAMRYAIMGYQPAKRPKPPLKQGEYTNDAVRRLLNTGQAPSDVDSQDFL